MCRRVPLPLPRLLACVGALFASGECNGQTVAQDAREAHPIVSSIAELRSLADRGEVRQATIRLEGDVLWLNPGRGKMVLQDGSDAEAIETDLPASTFAAGQRILISGEGVIAQRGDCISLTSAPVVANDGIHGMTEKSGSVFLRAGKQPIRIDWFNRTEKYGLEVEYEGPDIPRQSLSHAEIFCPAADSASDGRQWENGFAFECYEGSWMRVPDFKRLIPAKSGRVQTLDLNQSRLTFSAMEFHGVISIPRDGTYTFHVTSDDGSLLFAGEESLKVVTIAKLEAAHEIAATPRNFRPTEVEGVVTFVNESRDTLEMELSTPDGKTRLEMARGPGEKSEFPLKSRVHAQGLRRAVRAVDGRALAGNLLVQKLDAIDHTAADSPQSFANSLPTLTSAEQIRRLKSSEAKRKYPVKLKGVITCQLAGEAAVIQDSTAGIYFEYLDLLLGSPVDRPEPGGYYEISGVTAAGNFSPIISASKIVYLGPGALPEPRPTRWDQLMNGSLDSQYVEISGIVTDLQEHGIALLSEGGNLAIEFDEFTRKSLGRYLDGFVRIRGCLLALWNEESHQVKLGKIRMFGASINLEEPAPADPFASDEKSIPELRRFDAKAGTFHRVKVSGQVIHVEDGIYYLSDGANGVRLRPKSMENLALGDLLEVVGFPELGGASPTLRAAIPRRMGHRALPAGKRLSAKTMSDPAHDSTLVRVEGRLIKISETIAGAVYELEAGSAIFMARSGGEGTMINPPPVGSLVDVAGVYVAKGGTDPKTNGGVFEILLNSPGDLQIIERASWWTPRHTLGVGAVLLATLLLSVIWIGTLHRRVEEKTRALKEEIEGHERTEAELERKTGLLEAEMEERKLVEAEMEDEQESRALAEAQFTAVLAERNRMAREIHDTLAQGFAAIFVQLEVVRDTISADPKIAQKHLDRARDLARDSLEQARRTIWNIRSQALETGDLATALEDAGRNLATDTPARFTFASFGNPRPLSPMIENHLLRIGQEAVTNAIKHSQAAVISARLSFREESVLLEVCDDGIGHAIPRNGGDTTPGFGLLGMEERAREMGASLSIKGNEGKGTTVSIKVSI